MSVQDNGYLKAFAVVFGALILFTVSIMFLSNIISSPAEGYTDPLVQSQLIERVRPVGQSRLAN